MRYIHGQFAHDIYHRDRIGMHPNMFQMVLKTTLALFAAGWVNLYAGPAWGQTPMGDSSSQVVTDSQLQSSYDAMSQGEKKRLFCNLPDWKKRSLMANMPTLEKQLVFDCLMVEDKRWVLQQLKPQEIAELFAGIDAVEQRLIFNEINEDQKKLLLERMKPEDRSHWLMLYPELSSLVSEQPAGRSETDDSTRSSFERKRSPSRLEKILSGTFPQEIDRRLEQFGYDFFGKNFTEQTPMDNIPVGDDYAIGPGDQFTIYLWGKVEHTYPVVVNRDGTIIIPRIGSLTVTGMTMGEAKTFLRRRFKEYYPEFEMSIIMGKLRVINVYVVGEAVHPGMYTLSALSTVMSALSANGGPAKEGSLRNIRVLRQGEKDITVDLYDFFISGDKSADIRLRAGDTLLIPVIGPVVGIAGSIRRPAIYELKETHTISDIIALAGGVLPFGHLQNVVVERVENHRRRVVRSFNLDVGSSTADNDLNMPVADGDVIKIYPVHRRIGQVVYLEGHVKYPREYELKPGMKLSDILSGYNALLPEPYLERAEIIRLVKPDLHPEIIGFDLEALLAGDQSQDILLEDLDRVKVYNYLEKVEVPTVAIGGAVNSPGLFRLYPNMTIKDLIFRAGNMTRRAYQSDASLSRIVPGESNTDTIAIKFSPQKAIQGKQTDNIELKPNDKVYIREIPQYALAKERRVTLEGEFVFPGEYSFSDGERISSLIERAGGLTKDAYAFGAIFKREEVKKIHRVRLKDYISNLEDDVLTLTAQATEAALDKEEADILTNTLAAKKQLLEKMKSTEPAGRMVLHLERLLAQPNSNYDFKLQPGDQLIVNKRPDFVSVLGEVYNPTAMMVIPGKQISYYLDLVGGPTDNADYKQIYLVRANGTVISKRQEGFFGISSWDSDRSRWTMGGFESLEVNQGDTIIVPKKIDKYSWLRLTKGITEIVYQIAVAAGVLVVVF
jgi:polysaccharide biosynthesis/export protein